MLTKFSWQIYKINKFSRETINFIKVCQFSIIGQGEGKRRKRLGVTKTED